jgi:hypothetical protein
MKSNLYDGDVFDWSQRQAVLLRRRAAGELVNEAELDWPNIAEEIESVGRDQLHAVESFLVQALTHDLKAEAWPLNRGIHLARRGPATLRRCCCAIHPSNAAEDRLARIYRRALRATGGNCRMSFTEPVGPNLLGSLPTR